ncbi:hypothetical protein IL306_007578, partial [Fusarium sp. DS 682]
GHEAAERVLRDVRDWFPEDERLLNVYRETRREVVDWRWVEATDAGKGKWIPVPFWDWEDKVPFWDWGDKASETGEDGDDRDEITENQTETQVAAVSDGANITE